MKYNSRKLIVSSRICFFFTLFSCTFCSYGDDAIGYYSNSMQLYKADGALKADFPNENTRGKIIVSKEAGFASERLNAYAKPSVENPGNYDIYSTHAFYESQGTWWRLDLSSTSKKISLVPVFSPDTNALDCTKAFNPLGNIMFFYETPGADNVCSTLDNNEYYFVSGYWENAEPKNITALVDDLNSFEYIYDLDDNLALKGFLVVKDNQIIRYNANFEKTHIVATYVAADRVRLSRLRPYTINVVVNGTYYDYDDSIKTVSNTPVLMLNEDPNDVTNNQWIQDLSCNGTECLVAVSNKDGNTLYLREGNATAAPIVTNYIGELNHIRLADSAIFYTKSTTVDNASYEGLYMVSKSGGNETLIDYADMINLNHSTSGAPIFYEKVSVIPGGEVTSRIARLVNNTGHITQEFPDSRWLSIGSTMDKFGGNNHVLLANNFNSVNTGIAGADLQLYDANTGLRVKLLGFVPNDIESINLLGYKGSGLITAYTHKQPRSSDLFHLDLNVPFLLQRITDTPDIYEEAVR